MIRDIKIKNHRIPWDKIREYFVLILFCAILALAAFGWGMIYENRRHEGLQEKIYNLESKQRDLHGRITSLEGRPAQKAESRRQ